MPMTNKIRAILWNITTSKKYKKPRNIILNIIILLITILIVLFLIEGVLRLANICEVAPKQSGNLFTFIQKNKNPSMVYELKPNAEGYLAGKYVKINSQGMRSSEISLKSENSYRIAFLGDSITFGWGVDANESYPEIFGEMLRKEFNKTIEILNFGVPGYVAEQQYEVLKDKVLDYNPDLLVIGNFLSNPDKIWNLYDTSIPIHPSIKIFFKEHSCLYNLVQDKWKILLNKAGEIDKSPYIDLYNTDSETWKNYTSTLNKISMISKESNIPVIIFILPNWHNLNESYEFIDIHNLLNKTIFEYNLHSIDTFPDLKNLNIVAEDYSIEHVHPNAKGHELLAEILHKNSRNTI